MKKGFIIIFVLIFLSVVLINCSEEVNESSITQIKIDPEKTQEFILSDWVSKIDLVPLETTEESVINSCWKIIEKKNKLFIQDQRQGEIFVFDSMGNFIFNTKHLKGKGPGEYLSLLDFNINPTNENIEILDGPGNKILVYDSITRFLYDYELSKQLLPFKNFTPITNDIYAFYSTSREHSLIFYSVSKEKIKRKDANIPDYANLFTSTINSPFSFLNGTIYFQHTFPTYSLYKMDTIKMKLYNTITLDFGVHSIAYDNLMPKKKKKYYRDFIRERNKVNVVNIIDLSKKVIAFYLFENEINILFFDKKTKTYTICKQEYNSKGQIFPPLFVKNNILFSACEPGELHYVIDKRLLTNNSRKFLDSISRYDNPIIVKYSLKD